MSNNPYRPDDNPYQASQVAYGIEPSGTADLVGVQRGVSLAYVALLTNLLCGIGTGILTAVFEKQPNEAVRILLRVLLIGRIVAIGLDTVARIICLSAPQRTNAGGLIIAAVVCSVANAAVMAVALFGNVSGAILQGISVVGFVGYLLFVLFLKRLAVYIRQPDLATSAQTVIKLCITMIAVGVLTVVGISAKIEVTAVLGLVFLVVVLWWLLVYSRLLSNLKEALRVA